MDAELVIDATAAIGTVAAVIVALYFSTKADSKIKAREARVQRQNSLYLLPILEGFHTDLQSSSIRVLFEDSNPTSMNDVNDRLGRAIKWAESFEKHSTHGPLSVESLSMLPEIVGLRIARALGMLHALRIEIARFEPNDWSTPHIAVAEKAVVWAQVQLQARDLIRVSIQDLEWQSKPQTVNPSVQELYGDQDED